MKFNVITVTYGKRFKFLKQVLDAIVSDPIIDKIIVVDNASLDRTDLDTYIQKVNNNQEKIILVRHSENLGSAGGFASGVLEARAHPCDFVLMLDDDHVPEDGWGEGFRILKSLFRDNVNHSVFSLDTGTEPGAFNVKEVYPNNNDLFKLSIHGLSGVVNFILRGRQSRYLNRESNNYTPIKRTAPCGYGGSIIPFNILKNCSLPDTRFFVYFDDILFYGSMIKEFNVCIYKVDYPKIKNIDNSFEDSNIYRSFYSQKSSDLKMYYWIRNRILIAKRFSTQGSLSVQILALFYILYIIIIGIGKSKNTNLFLRKTKIVIKAYLSGVSGRFIPLR